MKRSLRAPLAATGLLAVPLLVTYGFATNTGLTAPLFNQFHAERLGGKYIVVLKDSVRVEAFTSAFSAESAAAGANITHTYNHALKGFAGDLTDAMVEALRRDSRVKYIEADTLRHIDATQTGATWGIDRTDQRDLPLSGSYTYANNGAGVNVYVIDTGIRISHQEIAGRAFSGYDAVGDGNGTNDCNGHGTHVSGTIGGTTYGMAKGAKLFAVRVLDCNGSGTTAGVVAGIDWVTSNAVKPATANMSLGGGASQSLDDAVVRSINSGVVYGIAAGNSSTTPACNQSPARVPAAITVAASDSSDAAASFTSYGSCVDIYGPGVNITSSWNTNDSATNTISGTSMATPHVVGATALYLQSNPTASPQQVRDYLVNQGTPNKISGNKTGTPNILLNVTWNTSGGPTPTPTVPPTVTPTVAPTVTPTVTPTVVPTATPDPSNPCPSCQVDSGSLNSGASKSYASFTANAGQIAGYLRGPAGTDFDLYLYKWNGSSWSVVAYGISTSNNENVIYNGTAGTYYWKVKAYSGSGAYKLYTKKP